MNCCSPKTYKEKKFTSELQNPQALQSLSSIIAWLHKAVAQFYSRNKKKIDKITKISSNGGRNICVSLNNMLGLALCEIPFNFQPSSPL
jgi:mRNA degradation ribonuclease J1/J2